MPGTLNQAGTLTTKSQDYPTMTTLMTTTAHGPTIMTTMTTYCQATTPHMNPPTMNHAQPGPPTMDMDTIKSHLAMSTPPATTSP